VPAYLANALPHLRLTAADVLHEGLARARPRLEGVAVLQLDARALPFEEEFDVVGAFDVLEHIDDDGAVLSQMYKATRPGGGIVVTVPQHAWMWTQQDDFSHHKRRYSRADAMAKVGRAGYRIRHVTSFVTLLLPLLALSRLTRRADAAAFDPVAELRISPSLNGVFGFVSRIEQQWLTLGWSMPVGGSLLLIGARSEV
jgi:SAM-dependent methyltransferase